MEILETKDDRRWGELLNNIYPRDIFFTPEYAILFEKTRGEVRKNFGGKAHLLFCGNEENYIIYPFFKRKLSLLPFYSSMSERGEEVFDSVSPYGYSGPLARIRDRSITSSLWKAFLDKFHEYCIKERIVAEFVRFHPFINNKGQLMEFCSRQLKEINRVVFVDLTASVEDIWRDVDRDNRRKINKARRNGITVHFERNLESVMHFYEMYAETMKRKEARPEYIFSKSFFYHVFKLLEGKATLAVARYRGEDIASILHLHLSDFVHAFLACSNSDYIKLHPNNLLFYESIMWAKREGYRIYNLGGGMKKNDSLFFFKSAFSKSTLPFHIYTKIHDEDRYQELCKERMRYRERMGEERELRPDYFPLYRA
ncbi:MAG: GNAT family N-acetyltransferase [bacterium]|nr:GNAT family N-acetyltransferase [bacterium]